jgi:hypothetical protein
MNKVEIYNLIKEATKGFTTEVDVISLAHLKAKLEEDIKIEEASAKTGSKTRIKSCLTYAKHQCPRQPIFQTTCNDQIEGYQVYTNTYMMVFLTDNDKLPIPDYKEAGYKEGSYPNVKSIVQFSKYNNENVDTYTASDLMALCKCNKDNLITTNKGYYVGSNLMLNFLKFLNFNPKDNVVLQYIDGDSKLTPIYVVNSTTGSYGIILPSRKLD